MAYHVNAVPVKDNENKRTRIGMLRCRPILLIVLRTGLYAHTCSLLGHPKILRIRVFWSPVGMGDGQNGYHKVSYMTAPRGLY